MRAFKAANKPLDVVATIQSDDNPLLCAWKKEDNPNFKVWVQSALFTQGRTALTAAMMKQQDAPIPCGDHLQAGAAAGRRELLLVDHPRERVAVLDGPGGSAAEDVRQVGEASRCRPIPDPSRPSSSR